MLIKRICPVSHKAGSYFVLSGKIRNYKKFTVYFADFILRYVKKNNIIMLSTYIYAQKYPKITQKKG